MSKSKLICTDLDGTFIGDDDSMYELLQLIDGKNILLVFDTGRHLPSVMGFVQEKGIRIPDASICMVGTEIFVRGDDGELVLDSEWSDIISDSWQRNKIVELLGNVQGLTIQDEEWQTKFKASYFLRENVDDVLREVDQRMQKTGLKATAIHSAGAFLDFLPIKSGKAKATDYLAKKFGVPKEHVVACGDSGNDLDLFEAGFKGIIVGNAHSELSNFRGPGAYHATGEYSAGIIEGLRHFDFL